MVAGLLKPDAGEISICGINALAKPVDAKTVMAWVPDKLSYGQSSIHWNIWSSLPAYGRWTL